LTPDGFEIASTHAVPIANDKRFINPKMEQELCKFKSKIQQRYLAKEIADYRFPRV